MVNYTYSKLPTINFNTTPASIARSATGSVYAIGDTTYTTPLNMTLVVGGSVVTSISSDANGLLPDFTLLDRTSCVWKQTGVSFATVLTTSDPVPGPQGAAGSTGATGAQGVPGDVSTWKPTTFYPLNTPVTNPSGDLVKVTTAHTSTGSYDATKFSTPYDAAVQSLVNTPGSATQVALFATTATQVASEVSTPGKAAKTALDGLFVRVIPELEAAPVYAYGHSYVYGDQEVAGSKWVDRVASRYRTLTPVNNGVNGTSSYQIADKVIATWTPGSRGLVLLMILINDVQFDSRTPVTQAALGAMLSYLSSGAAQGENAGTLAYAGDGWASISSGAYTGGTAMQTTTIGDYVDVAWNGDECAVLTRFGTSSTEGTVTATNSGTQTVVSTTNLGGYYNPVPGVIKFKGYGPGDHTARLTLTAGTKFIVDAVLVANPKPPKIVIVREGPVLGFLSGPFVSNVAGGNSNLVNTFEPALDSVAAEYPNVIITPTGGPEGWDPATMLAADKLHPNAKGSATIATAVTKALGTPGWTEGLNPLGAAFTAATPKPLYVPGTAATPAKVRGVTASQVVNSLRINWAEPPNNGSLITDYLVEYKLSTDPTWTPVTHTASTALTMDTPALTSGTYNVRVSAINAIGTGAASTAINSTVVAVTIYASDNFNRADSSTIGSTPIGAFAWTGIPVKTSAQPAWSILGNALKGAYASGTTEGILYVDDAQANGRAKVTFTAVGDQGLAFRVSDSNNFWMLWTGSGLGAQYKLMKMVAGTYTTVATATKTAAHGDVLDVTFSGSTITAFINGVQVATTTDAFNSTATKHGIRGAVASGQSFTVDDFSHTSS